MEETKSKENILSHESEKKNLEDEIMKLKDENADLIAQLQKLKRVLTVMEKQLKLIKGKKEKSKGIKHGSLLLQRTSPP